MGEDDIGDPHDDPLSGPGPSGSGVAEPGPGDPGSAKQRRAGRRAGGPADPDDPRASDPGGASSGASPEIDQGDGAATSAGHRVLRFARRIMDRRDLAEDTKELLHTVLTTSDKAKTEAVRMIAREVRNYLSELRLKDDLLALARSHSLEISISLKPLADLASEPSEDSAD